MADYTAVLAAELARLNAGTGGGDSVTVVTGPLAAVNGLIPSLPGVSVVTLSDHFAWGGRGLHDLEACLANIPAPHRILVQYAPQPLGPRRRSRFKGLPLSFAWWLRRFARRRPDWPVWTMLHEALILAPTGSAPALRALSLATGQMLKMTVSASERLFVATPAWVSHVTPYLPAGKRVEHLPIPSNVGTSVDPAAREKLRAKLLNGRAGPLLGHFGTFSSEVTDLVAPLVRQSLDQHRDRHILLAGNGSREFACQFAADQSRLTATGRLGADDVSHHLAACDVLIQPFPDGITTRRGSIMAGLALAVPIVSNLGTASESLWREQNAVALAPDPASMPGVIDRLLLNRDECRALGDRGRRLYESQFSLAHTIRILCGV